MGAHPKDRTAEPVTEAAPTAPKKATSAGRRPILFHAAPEGGELAATAEVQIFEHPAVVLRGWLIYRRAAEIVVVPPHQVVPDPETGEKRVWYYLDFEDPTSEEQWKARIKSEFLKWEKTNR